MHLAVSSFLKQNFLQVYFSNIPAKYSEVQAEPDFQIQGSLTSPKVKNEAPHSSNRYNISILFCSK